MKIYVFRSSVPSHNSSVGDSLSDLIMGLLELMVMGRMMDTIRVMPSLSIADYLNYEKQWIYYK